MKPNFEFDDKLFLNEEKFKDSFFKQFKLRHAPQPLQLTDKITKNYMFPTFYSDVTCAQAIFMCDYKKAKAIMPHPKVKPVKMPFGRAIVAFSCYEYKNVMNVPPYNEIAMTIPVMVDPVVNVPVLPMVMDIFKEFGYYVFSMPVTSKENMIRGRKIWGLPKVVEEIDIFEDGDECVTTGKDEKGEQYIELRVPMKGEPEDFDVKMNLYSRLDDKFLQSQTCFKASFNVSKYMQILFKKGAKPDRQCIKIGGGPSGRALKELDIEEHPFQFRFAKHMNAAFDLSNPNYKSPIKY
jgi:hypothetical protein